MVRGRRGSHDRDTSAHSAGRVLTHFIRESKRFRQRRPVPITRDGLFVFRAGCRSENGRGEFGRGRRAQGPAPTAQCRQDDGGRKGESRIPKDRDEKRKAKEPVWRPVVRRAGRFGATCRSLACLPQAGFARDDIHDWFVSTLRGQVWCEAVSTRNGACGVFRGNPSPAAVHRTQPTSGLRVNVVVDEVGRSYRGAVVLFRCFEYFVST
jgi:hypothetical protein